MPESTQPLPVAPAPTSDQAGEQSAEVRSKSVPQESPGGDAVTPDTAPRSLPQVDYYADETDHNERRVSLLEELLWLLVSPFLLIYDTIASVALMFWKEIVVDLWDASVDYTLQFVRWIRKDLLRPVFSVVRHPLRFVGGLLLQLSITVRHIGRTVWNLCGEFFEQLADVLQLLIGASQPDTRLTPTGPRRGIRGFMSRIWGGFLLTLAIIGGLVVAPFRLIAWPFRAVAQLRRRFFCHCPSCQSDEVYAVEFGHFATRPDERALFVQRLYCERCTRGFHRPGMLFGAPRPRIRPLDLYD